MEEAPEYIVNPKANKKQTLLILIKFGVGAALAGMLFDELGHAFPSAASLLSFFGSLAPVLACTIGLVYYKQFNFNLKFGKIYWFCLRMGLVVATIQSLFLYLNLKFFNRALLEALRQSKLKELVAFNQEFNWISREDLIQQTEPSYFNTYVCGPGVEATGNFFWTVVFFLFIGLFIALFNRNRNSKNPFQKA
jgi:hypothetical protein